MRPVFFGVMYVPKLPSTGRPCGPGRSSRLFMGPVDLNVTSLSTEQVLAEVAALVSILLLLLMCARDVMLTSRVGCCDVRSRLRMEVRVWLNLEQAMLSLCESNKVTFHKKIKPVPKLAIEVSAEPNNTLLCEKVDFSGSISRQS